MSDIKGKYKKILEDLESNIKDEADLIYAKEKFMELTLIFMDIVDRLTLLTDARIKEIEERQQEISEKINSVQSMVDEIEGDIYEEEEDYEFEIVCPYCNYQFTTDIADEEKEEIKCPKCHNMIELDWNADEEYTCPGDCSHCHGEEQVAEEEELYGQEGTQEEEQIYKEMNQQQPKRDREERGTKRKETYNKEENIEEEDNNEDEDM